MVDISHTTRTNRSEFFADKNTSLGLRKNRDDDHIASNEDGSICACLDGEIYNTKEIQLPNITDAERIAHLYEHKELEFIHMLRGPFAIAIWDANKQKLLLIRDKIGERPLFYAHINQNLLFASQIKSILQFEEIKRDIDFKALDHYFTYSYIPAPLTIFKEIRELPSGYMLEYSLINKTVKQIEYWEPNLKVDNSLNEDDWSNRIYEALKESTKIRLNRHTAPIGGLLSGGIDSSIILALLRRLTTKSTSITAFTTGFDETEYDETKDAKQVAEFLDLNHHIQIIDPADIIKFIPKVLCHLDEPLAGNAVVHAINFEFARKFTSEAFNGDGGDEAFSYPVNLRQTYNYYQKIFGPPLVHGLKVLSHIPKIGDKAKSGIEFLDSPEARVGQAVASLPLVVPFKLKNLYNDLNGAHDLNDTTLLIKEHFSKAFLLQAPDSLSALNYVIFRTHLPNYCIKLTGLSSATPIVVRSPILDIKVMSMTASIPSYLKIRNGMAKYIFRRTAEKFNLLPKEIIPKGKIGFSIPVENWLRNQMKHLVAEMLDSVAVRSYLKLNYVKKIVRTFESSPKKWIQTRYAAYLWSLIMFTKWHELYMEKEIF